ncbi:hypothetical protein TWF706_011547 [Orbilia oligospora]|nr:hypothetical protein TWF706_011547 [Orbilia oligospora]
MPCLVSTFGDRQLSLNTFLPEQCRDGFKTIARDRIETATPLSARQDPKIRICLQRRPLNCRERHWLGAARVRVFGNRALKPICYWFGLEMELLEHASAGIRPVHAHCARQVCSYGGSFIIALNYGLILLML